MGTVEPVLFAIVDIKYRCALNAMFGKVFDELKDGNNTHSIVCSSRCGGYRVIVGGKENSAIVTIVRISSVYLD